MTKLNTRQIDRLSEISGNFGLLLLGSMVLPAFTGSRLAIETALTAVFASLMFVLMSMILLRGKR